MLLAIHSFWQTGMTRSYSEESATFQACGQTGSVRARRGSPPRGRAMSGESKGKRGSENAGKAPRARKRSRFAPVVTKPAPEPRGLKRARENEGPPSVSSARESRFSVVTPQETSLQSGVRPSAHVDVTSIPIAPVTSIRINRNAAVEKKIKQTLKISDKDLLDKDPDSNPYFDPSIGVKTEVRRPARSGFQFVEQGKIAARAERLRERAEEEVMKEIYREKIAARAAENSAVPELPAFMDKRQGYADGRGIPAVEWWDVPLVVGGSYVGERAEGEGVEGGKKGQEVIREDDIALDESKITVLVHHPKKIASSLPEKPPVVLPLMLTEKERKRLRRQRRQEKNKEEQEMIAVGLRPAPPPKVKLSNMMRVLAEEASADPTKMEMEVRKQVEARRQKHENDNEMRRLTKEERRDKVKEREVKDRASGLSAAVFRITSAENPQHRFKVVMNARQLGLSGSLVVFDDCNVVVVEGGSKALSKFKKLMLRRIDWTVVAPPEKGGEGDGNVEMVGSSEAGPSSRPPRKHECVLVWEGAIAKQAFQEFKTVSIWSENGCRLYFRKRRVEQYWDLCVQASPPGDTTLGVRVVE